MDGLVAFLRIPAVQALAILCAIAGLGLEIYAARRFGALKLKAGQPTPPNLIRMLMVGSVLFGLEATALGLAYYR